MDHWETKYRALKSMIEDDSKRYAEMRRKVALLLAIREEATSHYCLATMEDPGCDMCDALNAYDEAMK